MGITDHIIQTESSKTSFDPKVEQRRADGHEKKNITERNKKSHRQHDDDF